MVSPQSETAEAVPPLSVAALEREARTGEPMIEKMIMGMLLLARVTLLILAIAVARDLWKS